MARLLQLRRTCDQGNKCPTLHYQPGSDEFLIQGYTVTDPQILARLNLPAGQTVVRVPSYLLPELQRDPGAVDLLVQGHEVNDVALLTELNLPVGETVVGPRPPAGGTAEGAPAVLTDTEFGEVMSSARRSLFRLETLDRYEVSIDGSDLSVYLAGGDQPPNPEKLAWQEHLRAERAAGIWRHRVHLIDTTHGLGATCATSASGDTPRPPRQGRASASSICLPPTAP